jgi:hypothetical protein
MARTYKYQSTKNSIARKSTEALIDAFNALVGRRCWTSARASHDAALIDALKKGVDVSPYMMEELSLFNIKLY